MQFLENEKNASIVKEIVNTIHENATYLSEIDGETGDGDHGVNMNKGFLMAKDRISDEDSFSEALKILSRTLINDIGGSMGPIYGTLFNRMFRKFKKLEKIEANVFQEALQDALQGLLDLAGAKPGDKTLIDTMNPAYEAFKNANESGMSFSKSLEALKKGAEKGKESTRDMVAKIGRASRLGERSKGHLDAGATSCCLILTSMADGIKTRLKEE